MGDIESRPAQFGLHSAFDDDVTPIDGFDEGDQCVADSREAKQHAQPSHGTLDEETDLLHEQAFKLLHECKLKLNTRYERYQKAFANLNAIRETVRRDPYHSEAIRVNKTGAAASPALRRLFSAYREYDQELRRNDREIHNLEGTLKLYKDLVQKVEDHLNDSTNRELLKDYAETVQRVCERMGSQGENPIEHLLAATDRMHENTIDAGMTTETLRDEMIRLRDVQHEESSETVESQRRMFSTFVSQIASSDDVHVETWRVGAQQRGIVARDESRGVAEYESDADDSEDDDIYELSDDEDVHVAHADRSGRMPRALMETLPSVPQSQAAHVNEAVVETLLRKNADAVKLRV